MSLRDYFAAQALGCIAGRYPTAEETALAAYELADAMLAERDTEG